MANKIVFILPRLGNDKRSFSMYILSLSYQRFSEDSPSKYKVVIFFVFLIQIS